MAKNIIIALLTTLIIALLFGDFGCNKRTPCEPQETIKLIPYAIHKVDTVIQYVTPTRPKRPAAIPTPTQPTPDDWQWIDEPEQWQWDEAPEVKKYTVKDSAENWRLTADILSTGEVVGFNPSVSCNERTIIIENTKLIERTHTLHPFVMFDLARNQPGVGITYRVKNVSIGAAATQSGGFLFLGGNINLK
jgi:hypothetical protein